MRSAILSLIVYTALAACSSSSPSSNVVAGDEAKKLLLDRNWIDRMPENHSDRLHVYRFVPSMGGGVYQDRTLFKGTFELFVFETTDREIRFVLPETKQRVTSEYRIETVSGPAPFDLKLTIKDDPRGPSVYYGIRSETDKDGRLLDRRLAPLRAKLLN